MPAEDEGIDIGNPAGFIADKLREGISANRALQEFQEAGGGMRRQTWYRLFGQVADTIARQPESEALDPSALPDASAYGEWQMGQGGQYATQVNVMFRDAESGVIGTAQYTHVSDQPHTPGEAIDAAIDVYSDEDAASRYEQVILGGVATSVWQTVAFNR